MNFKRVVSTRSLLFLSIALTSMTIQAKSYLYIDGNNNDYEICGDSIIYTPVTAIESSSGEYSGGNQKRVKISTEQFQKIESIIKLILKDKINLIEDRLMGCGTLISGKKTTYINSKSPLKAELEYELKSNLQ